MVRRLSKPHLKHPHRLTHEQQGVVDGEAVVNEPQQQPRGSLRRKGWAAQGEQEVYGKREAAVVWAQWFGHAAAYGVGKQHCGLHTPMHLAFRCIISP